MRESDSGLRGSPDGWLDAAYECFVETGVDSVHIVPLAKKLKLSRTSFYWFYEDRQALLAALLTRWRTRNTKNLVRQAHNYAESIAEAILNVFDCWLDARLFDSKCEFAVRSWALQSVRVALEIKSADAVRIEALTSMFARFGYDALAADVRARTIYLTQIGYISMKTEEGLGVRMRRIPHYVATFTGAIPEPRELARFYNRHGYASAEAAPTLERRRATR